MHQDILEPCFISNLMWTKKVYDFYSLKNVCVHIFLCCIRLRWSGSSLTSSASSCSGFALSVCPKKVGDHSSKELTQTFSRHLHFPSLNCCRCQVSNTEFCSSILSLYSGSLMVAEKRCDWTNKDDLWFVTLLLFLSALYLLWPGSLLIPLIYTNLKPCSRSSECRLSSVWG